MSKWNQEHRQCHYRVVQKVLDKAIPSLRWSVYESMGSMCIRTTIEGHLSIHTLAADYCVESGMHNVGLIVDAMVRAWTELQYDIWRYNEYGSR